MSKFVLEIFTNVNTTHMFYYDSHEDAVENYLAISKAVNEFDRFANRTAGKLLELKDSTTTKSIEIETIKAFNIADKEKNLIKSKEDLIKLLESERNLRKDIKDRGLEDEYVEFLKLRGAPVTLPAKTVETPGCELND